MQASILRVAYTTMTDKMILEEITWELLGKAWVILLGLGLFVEIYNRLLKKK